ncbi:hypothetical protein DM473_04365 [Lactobacillus helveticus]|uniref:hypothetical protein n=1 Tax=Lactobacillus helveticus TaxID=1587 RepID=UPI0001B853F1|nr:hypothetical protein [Lactobacillus helveticus]EEW67463.1 hypothetical protein HMPREF0518_1576 [Lactobacillus helveticus DSM 20075 = CGMCC 1.1877]AUJ27212.1 hypothetical protein Lh8627_01190 [Lactobacillus helveticus]AZA22643.1 MAG: hypothetical protein DQL94_09215 [Lactobacillus helveticus]KGL04432.1 hypothetical protein NB98_02350 [Lactobacillus helveticus]KGL06116.1 hypothetical protein MZ90_02345 [Lactobacillus helveticus]
MLLKASRNKEADNQTLPTSYTFKASDNEPVVVHLVHIKKTIEHTNPVLAADKTPTDKPIDGAHEDDLNKTITRTINVTDPEGTTKKTDQTATVPAIAGYTPTISSVATKPVTVGTDPEIIKHYLHTK